MFDDITYTLCDRALSGHWGTTMTREPITMDDLPGFDRLSPSRQAAEAIARVARLAPIRLTDGELLAGATTMVDAMRGCVPATWGGAFRFPGVNHTTPDFFRIVRRGTFALRGDIDGQLRRTDLSADQRDHIEAMGVCLSALENWARRYRLAVAARVEETGGEARSRWQKVARILARVPEEPAETFGEAVESLWLAFCFLRLCGNWPGIGRVDMLLEPYYKADLAAGHITRDEARELLAHFWIKGAEWAGGYSGVFGGRDWSDGSGDAQFYQNIVLGGCDDQGHPVGGEVTRMILEMAAELKISDFPIAVRINRETPEDLLTAIARVVRAGNGIVAVYNEQRIIDNLTDFGYTLPQARGFANDGCWEIIMPGQTCFGYYPFDMLSVLQQVLGAVGDVPAADAPDFESLYEAFRAAFARRMDEIVGLILERVDAQRVARTPLIDLLVDDCLARGRSYYDSGARYTVLAPHPGGVPDTGNCLTIIRRVVYEEGQVTLPELVKAMRDNWQGHELLRKYIEKSIPLYGNDDPAADGMVARVFGDFKALCHERSHQGDVLLPPGVSTFGREMSQFRPARGATALGPADKPLATNFSPTPGTDMLGPTAVVRSHCRVGLQGLTNGTALELKLLPDSLRGEGGLTALTALMKTFVEEGGIFVQFDMVDTRTLLEAKAHPDRYPRLAVRVSGWSARFNTLSEQWQDLIIARTQQQGF